MKPLEKARQIAQVLRAYMTDRGARLRYGMRQRETLHAAARAGQAVTGYRVEWTQHTARRVLAELRAAAHEFDAHHPWDAVSIEDMKDVIKQVYNCDKGEII